VVTGVLSLVKRDVSVSILVINLGWCLLAVMTSSKHTKVLETDVGGGVCAIVGEGTHMDVRRSVSVVH